MYTVTVNVPGAPEGLEVEVLYLGLFPNGSTYEVEEAQVQLWELLSNKEWPESGHLDLTPAEPEVVLPPVEDEPEVPVEPVIVVEEPEGGQ